MRKYEHNMPPRVDTIKDNNVDYDNNSIPAMRQRIAELESKLEEVEGQYAYECGCNAQLVELQQENEKLKEQLKNAIVPKYNLDQYVYVIRWGKPYRTRIDVIKAILIDKKVTIFYEYDAPGSYAHVEISEDGVFATEAEAQKYLEERK